MVGGGGGLAPHLKNEKKRLSEEILISHLYFTNEIKGGSAYMQHRRGWADRRVSMVGGEGGEGVLPP